MRNLNANALAKIAEHHGNEPITIVDIAWTDTGTFQYADRDIEQVKGRILDLSKLDAVINIHQTADSQEISVVLNDTDGKIKTIMDNNDIHMRDAWVYQWFEGLDITDRFLLFKGKVNSPIIWSEGERTVSFTILAQIEDNEVGFSPEEGEISGLPRELIGEPWPMVFGTVTHSKTLRLTSRLQGVTAKGVGFPDFALPYRQAALTRIGQYDSYMFTVPSQNTHLKQAAEVAQIIAEQRDTIVSQFYIFGGEKFPRGNITIQIGSVEVTGHFGSGNSSIFYISGGSGNREQHPANDDFLRYVALSARALAEGFESDAHGKILPYATGFFVRENRTNNTFFVPDGNISGSNAGYIYVTPGSTVRMASTEPQQYVVSITPGIVLRVVAWTTKDGQHFIQDVPTNWYSVRVEQIGIFPVTIITINDSLSKKEEMGFEDEIYVTFKSTIGPNTVNILEYLIQTFSDFEIDTVSFNHVRTRLQNYPSHFALYDKKNIVNALQEIAWQACSAIYLKNGKFYLIYLPEEQTSVDVITKNDILSNTFELDHTPTEDLVTKMVCSWTASGIQEKPFTTILQHNVNKYGLHKEDFDYYIYDFADAIVKSATFWLIRYSNTWKKARFDLPLTKMNLETFDFVTLDLGNIISNEPALVMIEGANYDSNLNALIIECWCPVKAGTMDTYDFAYPADQLEWKTFPTNYEIQEGFYGGNSPGKNITGSFFITEGKSGVGTNWPDEENEYENKDPYNEEKTDEDDRRNNDKGNPNPSDVGDISPGDKIIKEGSTIDTSNPAAESGNRNGAPLPGPDGYGGQERFPEGPSEGSGDGEGVGENVGKSGGNGDYSEQQAALDGLDSCNDATYLDCPKVRVLWIRMILLTYYPRPPCTDSGFGYICSNGYMDYETIVFNTNAEAQAYADSITALTTGMGVVGGDTPNGAIVIPGVDDCQENGRADGPIAYCSDSPDRVGSGSLRDGTVQTSL